MKLTITPDPAFDKAFAQYESTFTASHYEIGMFPDKDEFYIEWMESKSSRRNAIKPITEKQRVLDQFLNDCNGRSYKEHYLHWCSGKELTDDLIYSEKGYLKALKS